MNFTIRLLQWYQNNKRDLPWRNTRDPYKIWLSEIILQQTRVNQGVGYYLRFINEFPTVQDLAQASEDRVLSVWQGLGYYSRARNLHTAAKEIAYRLGGEFPKTPGEIIKLKGIGPYTAAAIASIAFDIPVAAIDGNVARVIARYFCIEKPVDDKNTQNTIREAAQLFMDNSDPGTFNQALMDFGALQCKPGKPLCNGCPFFLDCAARIQGKQDVLPLKSAKIKVKERFFHYFFVFQHLQNDLYFLIEKRTGQDIWKGLYQFPMIELSDGNLTEEILNQTEIINDIAQNGLENIRIKYLRNYKHKLTHQLINAYFYAISTNKSPAGKYANGANWVSLAEFENLAKPVLLEKFIREVVGNIIEQT